MPTDPQHCQAVLFDMDGTLLDTVPLIVESFQYVLKKHTGSCGDEAQIRESIGTPLEWSFRDFPPKQARTMVQDYIRHNQQKLDTHVGIFLGIVPLLAALHAEGYRLGVVTSKRLASAEHSLKFFEIRSWFDVVIGKESTRRHKPDREPIDAAMRQLHLDKPSQVVFVGDSLHDLICGQKAGCKTAIVDWTAMPKAKLRAQKPDLWLNHAQDLLRWLQSGGCCR